MTDHFSFACSKLAENKLRVLRFHGHEALNELFRYEITAASTKEDMDLGSLIGQTASLSLEGANGKRNVHGIIERCDQLGTVHPETVYRVVLVPSIAPLAYTRNSCTFQGQGIIDIVRQILNAAKFPTDCLRVSAKESRHKPRDYCVQYQESDLTFITRLLEEEGVYFYFDQTGRRDVLVLADSPQGVPALPDTAELPYRAHHEFELDSGNEGITEFIASRSLYAGSVVLRDFRFMQPDLSDMEVSADSDAFTQYQRFYFPGEYVDPQIGAELARVRMEEQQWPRRVFSGKATATQLAVGYKFRLTGDPRSTNNQEYLCLSFSVQGANPTKERRTTFEVTDLKCIPADVAYRPLRQTERPVIPGVQTAMVVGPKGEEIHCDKYGRVRVRFHWDRRTDRNGDNSCWIRVSQPWGGTSYGGMFLPRVGQEVLVQFIEGDPDRPIIVGRVYNGNSQVPYGLPDGKTRSTIRSASSPGGDGFNELRFEDEAGNEEIYVHAQRSFKKEILKDSSTTIGGEHDETIDGNSKLKIKKDLTLDVDGKRTTTIGGNDSLSVKKNQDNTIEGDRTSAIKGNDKLDVSKDQTITVDGNLSETVNKKFDQQVKGDSSHHTDASLSISAAKNISIDADNNLSGHAKKISIQGDQQIVLTVGGCTIKITESSIEISGTKIKLDGKTIGLN